MYFLGLYGFMCSLILLFHYRKSVVNIVVSEGPAVQGIYQQVIREFPDLIGGAGSLWESKRR